ncbi:FtsW/RodA/SpoVE family cell cycle protein [Candidatus Xiphinematobacter sp. Idaho Grape]|uniref:FtsW/RodA/SpoVE family cell cycle protein n=1 Tax=Candidatus Xiphinematobacter sp. Idaho Grape TaxID=1704307 RepID=UPI00078359F0|nr:FtsW/RodA/SpoVE family cell cycle protein [Candidatus Xiphinematobacter sp. Idaho Grape]
MHPFLKKLLGLNWLLLTLTLGLGVYGIYSIYSATWMRDLRFYNLQIAWFLVSLPVFLTLTLLDYHWLRWCGFPLYLLGIGSLAVTYSSAKVVYGSGRWLSLGSISFQPSSLAIVTGIIMLAIFLHQSHRLHPLFRIMVSLVLVGVPAVLVLLQPDLGSSLVWGFTLMGMLFVAGIPKRYLIVMLLVTVAAVPVVVYFGLKPYQRERITTFLNPDVDPLNTSYNINQSLNAIGSGGLYGKGFRAEDTLNKLGYLPRAAAHNDFIFSVMGEQHGFLGGLCLVVTYALLLLTGLYVASQADDDFGCLLALGITMMLFAHIFMNLGMTVAVTPVTGLPLPLMSYGGTFLFTVMTSLALLQSIWIYRKGHG